MLKNVRNVTWIKT